MTNQAAQQKLEAESFLRRVQAEYPHLIQLGYQAIINVTVEGMKSLGIYHDELTEAKFMAGLMHSMNTGAAPKQPAQVVEVPIGPTAEQVEQERLAREDQERQRKYSKQQFASPLHNHANDVDPNTTKKDASARAEKLAKERAESIVGTSHAQTDQLRKVFVFKPGTSEINWSATEAARNRLRNNVSINPGRNRY